MTQKKKGFGRFIAERRRSMRLTQKELAGKIGVSKSAIAKWETDGGLPDRDNLKKLAEAICLSTDELHRIIAGSGKAAGTALDVNITRDVISALESYGYRVIGPNERQAELLSNLRLPETK